MKRKSLCTFEKDKSVQILTFKQKGEIQGGKYDKYNTPIKTIITGIGSSDINNID